MNVAVENHNSLNTLNNPIGLYDNGHLSAKIASNTAPFAYSYFQTFTENAPFLLRIKFTEFNANFEFKITGIEGSVESNEIILFLNLDNQLRVKAILEGFWEGNTEPKFQLRSFGLKLDEKQETPMSIFLSSTLWAMLGLSSKFSVLIPELSYDFTVSFELAIDEITKLLQERQIAYRLLVISAATGIRLPFPHGFIDGNDIEIISFCYHSIVDREFNWFANPHTIPCQATEESLSWLPKTKEPSSITFRPEPVIKSIFGINVPLGIMTVKINNLVIDNYEKVKEKLSKLDNEIVNVKHRSVDGTITMIAVDVPQLPQNPWSEKLQKLIDLDSQLDEKVLDRYFNLASSTLEGLTKKQKEKITKRPELDEEAFDF
jgi:hypothetical protein